MKSCVASRMRAPDLLLLAVTGAGADPAEALIAVEGMPTFRRSVARGTSRSHSDLNSSKPTNALATVSSARIDLYCLRERSQISV